MEKTKAELTSSNENINGEIYIGCGETEAISFLAQAARNLQTDHPLIHYHIYSGDKERVIEKPDKGLMRKDSLLAEKDKIQAEDLWDKPLILSHQTSINSEMALWLKTDFLN